MAEMREKYLALDEAIARYKGTPGALMPVLQEAQNIFGYVPEDVQKSLYLMWLQQEHLMI